MRKALQVGLLAVFAASLLHAAEFANLRNGFSIRHERHEVIGETTRLYLANDSSGGFVDVSTAEIEGFEAAPAAALAAPAAKTDRPLQSIIADAGSRTQIDPDFIASVIRAESGGKVKAVSPKGAQGLMQLMPQTASALGVTNSFDPEANVDGGSRYLRDLLLQYHGDAAQALAAYNAGPHRIQQYHGVPPYRETHAYVARVINDYNRKKQRAAKVQLKASTAASSTAQSSNGN